MILGEESRSAGRAVDRMLPSWRAQGPEEGRRTVDEVPANRPITCALLEFRHGHRPDPGDPEKIRS